MGFKMKPSSFKSGTIQGTSAYASALKRITLPEQEAAEEAQRKADEEARQDRQSSKEEKGDDVQTELIAGEDYSYYGGQEGQTESEREIDRQTRGEETEVEEETETETDTEAGTDTKPKKEEKAYGGTRTWSEGMEASGGKLNEWAKKAKTLDKNSAEYAEVQNKINEALGSKVRHSVPEVSAGTEEGESFGTVGSESTESTDAKKGREVTRDYDPETGTSTKTVTRGGDTKREVVRTGQETKNRGDDTVTRTRYTKDGGKVVTEKDALNRTRTRYDKDGNIVSGGETKERGLRGLADRAVKRFSKEGREAAQERRRQERVDKGPTIIQARKQAAKQRKEAEEQAAREAEEARRKEEGVGPGEKMEPIEPIEGQEDFLQDHYADKEKMEGLDDRELITKKQEATADQDEKPEQEFGKDERDFSDELTEERGEGDIYMEQQEQARLDAEEQAELEASDEATDDEQLAEALAEGDEIAEQAELEESDAAADEEALAEQAGDVPGAAMENIRAKFEETGTPPIYDDWAEAWENMNPGMKAPSREIMQKMFPAPSLPAAEAIAEGGSGRIEPLKPTPISTPESGELPKNPEVSVESQVNQRKHFSNFRDLALELETAKGRENWSKVRKLERKMMEARQKYIDAGGDPSQVDMRNLT